MTLRCLTEWDRALRSPGWRKDWHVGVRATQSRKLVAFISGVPLKLRVRGQVLDTSEINFLCVHKRLRSKRLAPVMIKEITRQSHLLNIQQAIYTAGVVLPRPVSTCRYFHRMINWEKLHEVGFCHLPAGSTVRRQVTRSHIPSTTSISGLRLMEAKDINAVHKLLAKYLRRFDLAPQLTKEEVEHLLLHQDEMCPERVVWTYVIEVCSCTTALDCKAERDTAGSLYSQNHRLLFILPLGVQSYPE